MDIILPTTVMKKRWVGALTSSFKWFWRLLKYEHYKQLSGVVWAAIAPFLEYKNVGIIENYLGIFLPSVCMLICVSMLYSVLVIFGGSHKFLRWPTYLISHELKDINWDQVTEIKTVRFIKPLLGIMYWWM